MKIVLAALVVIAASCLHVAAQRGNTAPAPQGAAVPSPPARSGAPAPPSVGAKPQQPRSGAASATRIEAGATLYRKTGCFQCHVNEGQGGPQGPRLGPNPIPFARFVQYVRKPRGDMPPYTDKVISEDELAAIYAFLESRPRPPAVSTIPLLAP
jgi:mono/diheme cytochrome c family protein